jgi:filamentous hemagglutinin family protein
MNQAYSPEKASIKNILCLCLISTAFSIALPARAQIIPDNTLGAEASKLNQNQLINGALGGKIDGGAARGSNLFHSFSEFNTQDGQRVYFINPTGIENIFTRVTGGNASNIEGTLGVLGAANLFLINPNGILFGSNALLDVKGSFVGTTANGVQFGNQGIFSATNPQAPSLLTIQPSALWFNQLNQNAGIQNNSVASASLKVPDGKSLLLVGGNISMDGGRLKAYAGRVELGGLAEPGNVNLLLKGDNLSLKFPENVTRASVSLTNEAGVSVEAEAAGGGDIAINARNIEILGGSSLHAGIEIGLGTPETVAGDITLNATGEIKIAGKSMNNIPSIVRNLVNLESVGNGGNIIINSGDFSLSDGAQLQALTRGQGNAGNVTVNVKNAVDLVGFQTSIFSSVEPTGKGNGGNIGINATTLSLADGAQLQTLVKSDNQRAGRGDAGNVNVKVISGVDIAGVNNGFKSGISSNVQTGAEGNASNIFINSGDFSLSDGAEIDASNSGKGNTGDININSPKITLNNQSKLNAESASGNGGNINFNSGFLLLRHGAQISTNAGTEQSGGDGGNININSRFIVAVPEENSDISANAFTGTGGNIQINSQGIFGLESRPKPTDKSDITASSELGVSGVININTPDNNSIQNSFTQLSPNVIDTNALIANSCISRGNQRQENSFTITGSGALRNSPGDVLISGYTTGEVRNVDPTPRPWKKGDPIIEPQGLYRQPDGQLILSRECS